MTNSTNIYQLKFLTKCEDSHLDERLRLYLRKINTLSYNFLLYIEPNCMWIRMTKRKVSIANLLTF